MNLLYAIIQKILVSKRVKITSPGEPQIGDRPFLLVHHPSIWAPNFEPYPYAIWLFNIAMENDPFIDGLPIKNGDFPWLC